MAIPLCACIPFCRSLGRAGLQEPCRGWDLGGWVTNPSPVPSSYSLGSEAHAKAGQVSIGDGEEDHEDDVPGVMKEYNRQVFTGLHVAQHEKRYKDDAEGHHHWQEAAVLPGLGEKHRSLSS